MQQQHRMWHSALDALLAFMRWPLLPDFIAKPLACYAAIAVKSHFSNFQLRKWAKAVERVFPTAYIAEIP